MRSSPVDVETSNRGPFSSLSLATQALHYPFNVCGVSCSTPRSSLHLVKPPAKREIRRKPPRKTNSVLPFPRPALALFSSPTGAVRVSRFMEPVGADLSAVGSAAPPATKASNSTLRPCRPPLARTRRLGAGPCSLDLQRPVFPYSNRCSKRNQEHKPTVRLALLLSRARPSNRSQTATVGRRTLALCLPLRPPRLPQCVASRTRPKTAPPKNCCRRRS